LIVANKKDLGTQQVSLDEVQTWAKNNGGYQVVMTSALTGEGVIEAFKQVADMGSKASMQGGTNVAMPTSLSGAAGAIKLDAGSDAKATQEKKKKKGCC